MSRRSERQLPPEGFIYQPDFITEAEERELIARIQQVEFSAVVMHGVAAKRRVAHFGWLYAYDSFRITPGPAIPAFLEALQARAGDFVQVAPADLAEVLITEYPPGAVIGWHRDAPAFGIVVAVSLLSPCRLRLRRKESDGWVTAEASIDPRSAYALTGSARSQWQHSIPAARSLRYSITFRTLRKK